MQPQDRQRVRFSQKPKKTLIAMRMPARESTLHRTRRSLRRRVSASAGDDNENLRRTWGVGSSATVPKRIYPLARTIFRNERLFDRRQDGL